MRDLYGHRVLVFPENPSRIEVMLNYNIIAMNRPHIIDKLLKEDKITSARGIIFLLDINTPPEDRRKGYASKAFDKLIELAKKDGFEYILGDAVTVDGVEFCKAKNFEHIEDQLYGKKIE